MIDPFKLEKLKITAYSDVSRSKKDEIDSFEAMFNPESYKQKYEIQYSSSVGVNGDSGNVKYAFSKAPDLNLTLILDGTQGSAMDVLGLIGRGNTPLTVGDRVKKFIQLAYDKDGELHQPRYLKVSWGDLDYSCRLRTLDIAYTRFDRNAKPLRAELAVVFIADSNVNEMQKTPLSSPDLSHTRIVRSGDTLPDLCRQIYGSPTYYLRVAQANRLDSFRRLPAGLEIIFPPIEK